MDTKKLRYFLSVAEHRNFTAAAKYLYITQSALSHHIAELEKELGAKLFTRTTRSVSLTAAGEILKANAQDLIARFDMILEQIQGAESGIFGNLRIGYIISPFKKFLPDLLVRFRRDEPGVKLHYAHQNMAELHESLLQGAVDIAFTLSFAVAEERQVAWEPLRQDSMSLAMRKDHPMNGRPGIDYRKLAGEPFVIMDESKTPHIHNLMMKICASHGFVPKIVKRSHSVESVIMDVEAGFGVTIMPTSTMDCFMSDLAFIRIEEPDTVFSDVIAWKKDNPNPCIQLFIRFFNRYYCPDDHCSDNLCSGN
ncbi:MAG: LysR family transcriptional regulator [Clostridiales bacterium]|nr:LysR family transcriptional regulator [Clostridiales bacterium]